MNIPHTVSGTKVLVEKDDFDALLERMEELEDIIAFKKALADDDELLPMEIAFRIHKGESPVRVFREYRNLTQDALAEQVGVSKSMISKIESGHQKGSIDTLKAIAAALSLDLDDIA